jgi:glutamine amidotransferase
MITIIDYGLGNLGSILNVLRRVGVAGRIASDPSEIANAERLILPGVGAFDAGMTNLAERGLIEPIKHAALQRRSPLLGICLGMQLMCKSSEEGQLPGLGLIDAKCVRFDASKSSETIKIPHMGWSELQVVRPNTLFAMESRSRFYFVHSYHVLCNDPDDVTALARHGEYFTAAFERYSLIGVQFHPEKSHRFGMELLRKFAEAPCVLA